MAQTYSSIPPIVYAEASVRSVGGVSLFATDRMITKETVHNFYSDPYLVTRAVQQLRAAGFDVLQVAETTVTIAAPVETYERVFNTQIFAEEREVIKEERRVDTATFLDTIDTPISGLIDTSNSPLAEYLEGVAISEPMYFMAGMQRGGIAQMDHPSLALPNTLSISPTAPHQTYWHLDVPEDLAMFLRADRMQEIGFTGRGVHVAMVDTGFYRHPFYTQRGYRINPVVLGPGARNPMHDESGHGTGESANIFSVAPGVTFTMVKSNLVNLVGSFNAAVAQRPDVISCSWGLNVPFGPLSAAQKAMSAAIANAVRQGIIVVFAAGNGHYGFPAQHPDVIAAGGAYIAPSGAIEATTYASGFTSEVYPGRQVPDVCGLVGLPPKAMYIMLPVQPGDEIDRVNADGYHPHGDETSPQDGWAAFSGTSAAAPQVAGVCALMKQAFPDIKPGQVREILNKTARDVRTGYSAQHNPALVGPDVATGRGLVDAAKATVVARMRGMMRNRPDLEVRELEAMITSLGQ